MYGMVSAQPARLRLEGWLYPLKISDHQAPLEVGRDLFPRCARNALLSDMHIVVPFLSYVGKKTNMWVIYIAEIW